MVRGSDPIKVKQWTERLERFSSSNQTVAKFCQSEGVSQPSFYSWKKKLDGAPIARPARRRPRIEAAPAFKSVRLSPLDRNALDRNPEVTIRLPSGIAVELGKDLSIIETVMAQLLDRQPTSKECQGAGSC